MNCTFCQVEMNDPTKLWQQFEVMLEFDCPKCNVLFTVHERTNKTVQYTMVSGYYRLLFNLNRNFFVLGYNDHDSTANIYKSILELQHIPINITPNNAKEKIKTLLTFS